MSPQITNSGGPARDRGDSYDESRVDARRYLGALRRQRLMIAAIVVVVTGVVVGISLALPSTYEGRATILLDVQNSLFSSQDSTEIERRLSTLVQLIDSPSIREDVADELGDTTADDLEGKFTAQADPTANLIDITASDRDPDQAALIANTVAKTFIKTSQEREKAGLQSTIDDLQSSLSSAPVDEQSVIREQIQTLQSQLVSNASELDLVEPADVPEAPSSPRPKRNGILALFGALFIGILVALGRDQLRPAIGEPREISRITGRPILAGIPYVRTRFRRRNKRAASAIEHEAYQSLAAGLQLATGRGSQRLVMVTSGLHAEGKTTVTARLGRLLARGGSKTLLISADLRWPRLHELFDLSLEPGLTDALRLSQRAGPNPQLLPATVQEVMPGSSTAAPLHVITSGSKTPDPAALLSSQVTSDFFEHIREFDYDFVIVDAPPVLGIADCQALSRLVDDVVLVTRLDRVTLENVWDVTEQLERYGSNLRGHVVIGAKVEVSPYYLTDRQSQMAAEAEQSEQTRIY